MFLRGIRGATVIQKNSKEEILKETTLLLETLIKKNDIVVDDIASIIFSVTQDINAVFPAEAARNMGLNDTALLCFNEIPVVGSIEKCIRILIHANTNKKQNELKHIYLKEAARLRPDLAKQPEN
jgi:chorismate mutase